MNELKQLFDKGNMFSFMHKYRPVYYLKIKDFFNDKNSKLFLIDYQTKEITKTFNNLEELEIYIWDLFDCQAKKYCHEYIFGPFGHDKNPYKTSPMYIDGMSLALAGPEFRKIVGDIEENLNISRITSFLINSHSLNLYYK